MGERGSNTKLSEYRIKSYAKINTALDVVGVREDGYHLIETVMQQIRLADEIFIGWREEPELGGIKISVATNKPYLPTDKRNLAYRAAALMAEKTGKSGSLELRIKKKIPVAAGLGGGSSNAAAVMTALNRLWRAGFNTRQLCEMAKPLGADVPFLVLTHNTRYECALCSGTGDELRPLGRGLKKHIVLAKPAFGVSTAEVFGGIDSCVIHARPDIKALADGLRSGEEEPVFRNMVNVLEEYTLSRYAEVSRLKECLKATQGVQTVLMSGSGPTILGIYRRRSDARKACISLRKQGYEAYWTQTMRERGGRKNAEFRFAESQTVKRNRL